MTYILENDTANVETLIEALVECVDWEMLDREGTYQEGGDETTFSGADNPWYNAGPFFQFGARANGSIIGYLSKKNRMDKVEEQHQRELEVNGPESTKAETLSRAVAKATAELRTAGMLMEADLALFSVVLGYPFGEGTTDLDAMTKWYNTRKEEILNPRPTRQAPAADSGEAAKAKGLARLAARKAG